MAERTVPEVGTNGGRSNGHLEQKVIDEWRNAAYNCFSSGHKFCREVCPVTQVTRDERHTPTAFHANVVAMDKGLLGIEDVAEDYVNCTMCGACELRCPNTLFTGDFYRFRQRTIDVVKAMRRLAVESGVHQPNWQRWAELTDRWGNEPVLGWNIETTAGQGPCLGRRPRHPYRWRERAVRGLRGRVQATFGTARRGAAPEGRRPRLRPDESAVVLRRPHVGDRLRRRCPQDGRAQHDRLAKDGYEAGDLPRSTRLHHDRRALSAARRGVRRVRDRARRSTSSQR